MISLRGYIGGIGALLFIAGIGLLIMDRLRVFKPACQGGLYDQVCPAGGTNLIVPAIVLGVVGVLVILGTVFVKTND